MKVFSARLFATLATIGLGMTPAACGEKPSFVQQESTVDRRSSGNGSTAPHADAVKAQGGHGGEADVTGVSDTDGGGTAASSTVNGGTGKPGDETKGDLEPKSEGGSDASKGTASASGSDAHDPAHGGSDGDLHFPGSGSDMHHPDVPGGADGDLMLPTRKTMTREMSFPADAEMTAEASKTLDDPFLTQTITLKRNYSDRGKTVKQITRPAATDSFTQGTAGDTVTENFNQVAGRLLDILVVVDNSASMAEEQANLASKLTPLLSYVKDADWQIALVTTDPDHPTIDNCLNGLVKKSDANPEQKFANLVNSYGTSGSNNERHFLTAVRSLSGSCLTRPWLRPDSNVAVLIVSDEDSCSIKGHDCKDANGNVKDYGLASYLVNYLASIRQVGKNARVHGIIWHPSLTHAQCPTGWVDSDGEHRGYFLADAISQTNGTWGSICDADYSATLANVSKNILVTLNSKFMLQQAPDPGTLHVLVGGVEVTAGFTVTGRLLEFATAPADGAVITATYHHGSTPVSKSFALRYKPLSDRVAVTVNGQLAQPSDYAVSLGATAASVDFYAYPADKAAIAVSYTRDVPLNTQFALGDAVRAGSLRAKVNGVDMNAFTVLEASGVVTFDAAPAESATIDFAYSAVGAPVLVYPFSVNGAAPVDLALYDADTNAPIRFTYTAGAVVLDPSEFVEDRRVTLKVDNVARQRFSILLPNDPIPSTVVAAGGTKTCVAPAVVVTGSLVAVDGCNFADDVMTVSIRYNFVTAHYQEFTFTGDNLPSATAYQVWKVLVNGAPAMAYSRVGNVVTFPGPLPAGAVVKIQLIQEDK